MTVVRRASFVASIALALWIGGVTATPAREAGTSALPDGFAWCSDEGGFCDFGDVMDVAYGADNQFVIQPGVLGGTNCDNEIFGDPDVGVVKACFVRLSGPSRFTWCAAEGSQCTLDHPMTVAYGANGAFATVYALSGVFDCTTDTFGNPDPGHVKGCFVRDEAPDGRYRWCATEGQVCSFDGPVDVAYGVDGRFAFQMNVTGGLPCGNDTFGDPNVGVPKSCYFKPSDSVAAK
jgi:hypothetical protein